jgi:hypothetical protein
MVVPFLGLSIVPSQYVNLGASIDVGSYGGFNIRGYAGYVFGSWLLPHDDPSDFSLAYPYFGLGVSALDFVNRTEELFIEWKDHKHSALEVSGLNVDLVRSLTAGVQQIGSRSDSGGTSAFSGLIVRAASATYPLPFGDRRLFVGTSLLNIIALSRDEVGFGFLPIRAGYRFNLLDDELNLEPFAELTYYPVTMYHLGARLSVPLYDWGRVNVVAGFVSGSPNSDIALGLENLGVSSSWSTGYVGIGIGIGDVFHTPQEVMRK